MDDQSISIYDNEVNFIKGISEKESYLTGLTFNNRDQIIATSHIGNCVRIFDITWKVVMKFGSKGANEGQLKGPVGLVCDNDNIIYVADTTIKRIQVFDEDGNTSGIYRTYPSLSQGS